MGDLPSKHLARFQDEIKEIVVRAGALDIRDYELSEVGRLLVQLQPAILAVLTEAIALLDSLLHSCESTGAFDRVPDVGTDGIRSSYLPFERAIDATIQSKLGSFHAVEEITFIAQLELRQRAERLRRLNPALGKITVLGDCDSSLRRVRKALTAVDASIAKVANVSPVLGFTSELQASLAIRRAYAKFRMRVTAGGEPTPETLRARLRLLGTQIAVLVGLDIYPELRVRDRLLLRDLQERVLDWLRNSLEVEREELDPETGLRLWQDFAACVEMFALVNRRQELAEHDAAVVLELQERFVSRVGPVELNTPVLALLQELKGLDAELDELLEQRSPSLPALESVVKRLGCQFLRPKSRPPAAVTSATLEDPRW